MSNVARDPALLELLNWLAVRQYRFTTTTPLTHARVLARDPERPARTLTDIFGWSRPFTEALAGAELFALLAEADLLEPVGSAYRSRLRVSSLGEQLFLHSAYPTLAANSVFFGPDSYRFARYVAAQLHDRRRPQPMRCADIGSGCGVGAIATAARLSGSEWLLTDINPEALQLARVNAAFAGIPVQTQLADVLAGTEGGFDLLICNPPYLADLQQRAYRHGGGSLGRELSLRIAAEAGKRLNPGGLLLLYTGVAIVDGEDSLRTELGALFDGRQFSFRYEEIDPDVFGEELELPTYARADRIAVVGLAVTRLQPPAR